jgi:hypothetical protein
MVYELLTDKQQCSRLKVTIEHCNSTINFKIKGHCNLKVKLKIKGHYNAKVHFNNKGHCNAYVELDIKGHHNAKVNTDDCSVEFTLLEFFSERFFFLLIAFFRSRSFGGGRSFGCAKWANEATRKDSSHSCRKTLTGYRWEFGKNEERSGCLLGWRRW